MIEFQLQRELHGAAGKFELVMADELKTGTITALYGPSGSGKTSALRMLAGLMKPGAGYIRTNRGVWYDSKSGVNEPAKKRSTGFVFQDYALFPNMTVQQQLDYAMPKSAQAGVVDKMIETTGLGELKNRRPSELSGGQQQRVALARALVRRPELLLLDEPLAALDHLSSQAMQELILDLHSEFEPTVLLVSHDIGEIWRLADKVLVVDSGRVVRHGTPAEIFLDNEDVAHNLIGQVLEIEVSGESCSVVMRIGEQVVTLNLQSSGCEGIKTGDTAALNLAGPAPAISLLGTR